MVKLAKASKQATPKKKAPPPPKEEESSEEESSEEEEETPPPKKAAPAKAPVKAVKNGKAAKKPESEEEDDDEDDSEEEESDEEAPPPKPAAKVTPAKAPAPKAEESDDDDDEDDEEESEEEAPPPVKGKGTPAKPAAKAPVKAAPAEEESEDDDDDEDDSEEEMDTTPAAPAKKAGMVKAKEESEEEEDDDDEEDDEEEEDDDEDAPAAPAKRKADAKKETPPAKKAKADGEGFCLFVGNLNPNKEYDEIKDALRKFFTKNELEIVDVRLGGSKRFGYVEFASEADLDKALELNGKKVLGMEMKLDKAKTKENSQQFKSERDARTLFVKNLPFAATSDDLKEIFDDAVDIRLPLGQNGSNRGIAYIEFKSEEAAEKHLEAAQGADVQGRSILVDFVGQKSQQAKGATRGAAAAVGSPCKTLMVNNVAFSATEEVLQQSFEKAVSIRIPQNNGRSKGFAFVEFESEDDAKEAMESVNNTDIEGRTVRIEYSQQMGNRRDGGGQGFKSGPTKTLFVKGLSEDTTDETLRDSFDGSVGARIVTDRETGSSKGFGFVDFDNETDCQAAKEAMEEGEIDGNRVTLDYAKPKGEGGFRGGRGGGGFGGGGFRGGRGGGGFGGGRGGRGGGGFGGRGGGGRGGRGGGGRGGGRGFGGGRGGGGGFGAKPQGKKIKFDD